MTVFEGLLARNKDSVLHQTLSACGNYEDAEDVMSEATLSAYLAFDQLKDVDNFRAWLATIARRVCVNLKRRQAHEIIRLSSLDQLGFPEPPSNICLPNEQLETNELKRCVSKAVKSLPLEYQEVYWMREIDGLSARETSQRLGLSIPAIKSRLHRARKHVRAALGSATHAPHTPMI